MKLQVLTDAASALMGISDAYGASGTNPITPQAGGAFWVMVAIVYFSRKRKIGGWLLLFYFQLNVGLLLSIGLSVPTVKQMGPEGWESSARYVMFLVSTVPVLATMLVQVVLVDWLLFKRNATTLRRLRFALGASLVSDAIAVGIDTVSFAEGTNVALDVWNLIWTSLWLWYFVQSVRVKSVFIDQVWNYDAVHPAPVKTPSAVRKHVFKRAVLVGCLTFVVAFIVAGLQRADVKPDAEIFVVPVIWGLMLGLGSTAFPVRKRTREALTASKPQLDSVDAISDL